MSLDSEQKFWAWVVSVVSVSIVTLALGLTALLNNRIETYVENGYTRTTLVGHDLATWVKEDKSN